MSDAEKVKPGDAIVLSKWIALAGTSKTAREKNEELRAKISETILEVCEGFDGYLDVGTENEIVAERPVKYMMESGENGVFGSLWELGETLGMGLEVDLKKIPIRQETIELCETLDINPYTIDSRGSMIFVTTNGSFLADSLVAKGINASVIGYINSTAAKTVRKDGRVRYLEPPRNGGCK